ncbi:hypothetical protein DPEC_G00107320 [Dallia pectoralis]|uniref:Uncharacterized protein n=1 Tax=Dallia pectoralis TaxID=75939 RepID=A0ACC2GSP0_DALPE|nr:hypothetical protein DPEC_G00107320 [Dallia pectoralis]
MGHIRSKDTVAPLRDSSTVAPQQVADPTSLDDRKHPERSSRRMHHHRASPTVKDHRRRQAGPAGDEEHREHQSVLEPPAYQPHQRNAPGGMTPPTTTAPPQHRKRPSTSRGPWHTAPAPPTASERQMERAAHRRVPLMTFGSGLPCGPARSPIVFPSPLQAQHHHPSTQKRRGGGTHIRPSHRAGCSQAGSINDLWARTRLGVGSLLRLSFLTLCRSSTRP